MFGPLDGMPRALHPIGRAGKRVRLRGRRYFGKEVHQKPLNLKCRDRGFEQREKSGLEPLLLRGGEPEVNGRLPNGSIWIALAEVSVLKDFQQSPLKADVDQKHRLAPHPMVAVRIPRANEKERPVGQRLFPPADAVHQRLAFIQPSNFAKLVVMQRVSLWPLQAGARCMVNCLQTAPFHTFGGYAGNIKKPQENVTPREDAQPGRFVKCISMIPRPIVSFMSANYLGREKRYATPSNFGEGSRSIAEAFAPLETYPQRIESLFAEIAALGFGGVDLWTAHCNPLWATEAHYAAVREAAQKTGLIITSIAGGMGPDVQAFEGVCRLARGVGTDLLGVGGKLLDDSFEEVCTLLEKYEVRLGFENHPNEPTPAVLLQRIRHGAHPRIGVTLDTGWFATHDYPIDAAIDEVRPHLFLVHLKNIVAVGGHEAAPWDAGCLEFRPIVEKLLEIGYTAPVSIEYEPPSHDPGPQCAACREAVEAWATLAGRAQ